MIDRQKLRKIRKRNERGASMVELAFSVRPNSDAVNVVTPEAIPRSSVDL